MFRLLSIEIEDEKIKILECTKSFNGNLVSLNKIITIYIPPDNINDGNIINMNFVKDIICKALSDNNIKTRNAIFIINTSSVLIRNIKLPLLKSKSQTFSMIKIEFEQLISSTANYITIYKNTNILSESSMGNLTNYIVYGLPANIYNQYIVLAKNLNLKLKALDISANCLEILQKYNVKINDNHIKGINAFIYIDKKRLNFSVINNEINEFSRLVYFKNIEDEIYKAERVAEGSDEEKTNIYINEIYKYIRYYYSIEPMNKIENIYVYGNCTELSDIKLLLSLNLNTETEIIRKIDTVNNINNIDKLKIGEYFYVFLSLIASGANINFLSKKKIEYNRKLLICFITVSFLTILLILLINREKIFLNKGKYESEINAMTSYLNNENNIKLNYEIIKLKENILCLEKYIEQIEEVTDVIAEENTIKSHIFREISFAGGKDNVIYYISIDKDYIQMQCKSSKMEDILDFIKNLRGSSHIDTVYTPAVKVINEGELSYSYSIICKLRNVFYEN